MDDILNQYVSRHLGCLIVVSGPPTKWSNHHILAQVLCEALEANLNDIRVAYSHENILEVQTTGRVMIVSTDDPHASNEVRADFRFYVKTPTEVLVGRGMPLDEADANQDEAATKGFWCINDSLWNKLLKPEDVNQKNERAWKVFQYLWSSLMRLISERLHREDLNKESVVTRDD